MILQIQQNSSMKYLALLKACQRNLQLLVGGSVLNTASLKQSFQT